MTNKDFAIFNFIDEKEANTILNWFVENFDEKDIEKLANILVEEVKKSAATIHNFYNACIEIKKIDSDFCDVWILILEDLRKMANHGINAAKAGEEIKKIIKRIKS